MYSAFVALAASLLTFTVITLLTKGLYAILPAVAVLLGVYWFLARHHSKKVEALMEELQREIQQQRVPNAIRILRGAYPRAKWVFLLKGQIDGQIGTLLYIQKDFEEALPMLESAWVRHWVAKGMLASHWFRKHKPEQAMKVLDAAILVSKKEAMLYGLKAFMQEKLKDLDGARKTLTDGKAQAPSSEPLAANLLRLQNGEELRMADFGEAWWQFHLERPSQKEAMRLAGVATKAKGGKKAMYR